MPGNVTPGGASLQKHWADGRALLTIRQRQWDFVVLQDGPDGSYPERPNYWSYGTTFHVRVVEALRSARGSSFDLKKAPGFLQSAGFMEPVVAPGGEDFSFLRPPRAPEIRTRAAVVCGRIRPPQRSPAGTR